MAVDNQNHIYVCGLSYPTTTYTFFAYNTSGSAVWNYNYTAKIHDPGVCSNAVVATNNQILWGVPGEGKKIQIQPKQYKHF